MAIVKKIQLEYYDRCSLELMDEAAGDGTGGLGGNGGRWSCVVFYEKLLVHLEQDSVFF